MQGKSPLSRTVFWISSFKVTLGELIFTPVIIGIFLILGFVISDKIDSYVQSKNLRYNSAPHVTTPVDFKDRLATDNRDVFVSGHFSAVDTVNFVKVNQRLSKGLSSTELPTGEYLYASIKREHYTRHTRQVSYTDSDGHTRTKTETYYTWDSKENYVAHSNKIQFCDVVFDYDKIKVDRFTNTVNTVRHFDDRWIFSALDTDYDGIIFTEIKDGDIQPTTLNTYHGFDIDAYVDYLTESYAVVIFWVIWVIVTIAAAIGFLIIDNKWLE